MSIRRSSPRKALLKQMRDELVQKIGAAADKLLNGIVEIVELQDGREVLFVKGKPVAFKSPDGLFPTLFSEDKIPMKRVVVDMGAVPHVAGGADIMAPGVVSAAENIQTGECVVVVDERHGKALAIGSALVESKSMKGLKGRVIKNLHHVGDDIWKLSV
ncbi:MAG: RNA-binding protein [Candidatus Hadarchaeum sp.]|nr:RNA-binding protein [Candidatus Hadarchaeum sp.]